MGPTSGQIEQHINEQRGELDHNINELQQKVRATFDWRERTCARPFAALGIAFGAGVVLAAVLPPPAGLVARARSRFQERTTSSRESASNTATQYEKQRAYEAWDKIKGALLGLVTTRVQEFLAEAIPGFRQEFSRTEAYKTTSATHKAPELAESVYRQRANGPTSEWSTHS